MADYTIDRIKFGDNTYRLTDTESGYVTTDTKNTVGADTSTSTLSLVGVQSPSTYAQSYTTGELSIGSNSSISTLMIGNYYQGQIKLKTSNSGNNLINPNSLSSDSTFTLPSSSGTLALTSDITVYDVRMNGRTIVSNATAEITDSSGNVTFDGTVSANTLSLEQNHALYLNGSTSSSKVISADYGGANNVYWYTPGYYVFRTDWDGTNYKRVLNLSSSSATFDVPITASNHSSRIGAGGPDFSKSGYTQKTTSSVNTLGKITLPDGDWILKGWIQFPGGTAGYRRVWVTSDSGTTATGTSTLNQSYAAGSTICTVQCILFTHPTTTTTYYLRGASNVELTISYCDMIAIRIA